MRLRGCQSESSVGSQDWWAGGLPHEILRGRVIERTEGDAGASVPCCGVWRVWDVRIEKARCEAVVTGGRQVGRERLLALRCVASPGTAEVVDEARVPQSEPEGTVSVLKEVTAVCRRGDGGWVVVGREV